MGYTANDIRNICLLGHGGDGKSALCESMLFTTKAITRLGKRADGTTVSDFDDEEKKRQYSISSSVIPVEYNKCKINVIDNPGYFDFAGEVVQSLRVADAGLICVTAKSGIGVGTEKGWKYLAKAKLPAMFYVSKLDEEHANFFAVLDSLRNTFGASVIPFTFPILHGEQAVGVVDLIEKKAYDAAGKPIALPADAEEKIEEYMAELNEQVAETDEALMEKFFMEEPFTPEELLTGIKAGIRDRSVTPVFCGCAMTGLGTTNLMADLVKYAPNPLEGRPMTKVDEEGRESEFKLDPKGSPMVFVFNTMADQYGKNSYFKVISGDVEDTMTLVNVRTGDSEKLGNMFFPRGKDNTKTSKICCGDIGVFTKLASVKTGDTLGLADKTVTVKPMKYDEPMYKMAIYAKVKGTEDKIASG
ncbi:MAG: GTP-binding protein, partial [Clostridiales bacterium]|nr:GTP-binding protein [Clostridiales bacterium]